MNVENNYLRNMHELCKNHMHFHVALTMTDGSTMDGIVEHVDMNGVTVLAGEDVMEQESGMETRQYFGDYDYDYGRPRRRYRRYRRRTFPLATLAAIALLPYLAPYPYPNPYPYPYY